MTTAVHKANTTILQGANYKVTHIWKQANTDPIDLTGCHVVMQVKRTFIDPAPLLEASTYNGYVTLTHSQGRITVNIPATETRNLSFSEGVYDVVVIWPTGEVTRLIEGRATLSTGVSLTWDT